MCFPNEQDYSYFSRDNYSIKFVVKEKYTEQIDLLRNFKRNIEIEPTVDSSMLKGTTEIDWLKKLIETDWENIDNNFYYFN